MNVDRIKFTESFSPSHVSDHVTAKPTGTHSRSERIVLFFVSPTIPTLPGALFFFLVLLVVLFLRAQRDAEVLLLAPGLIVPRLGGHKDDGFAREWGHVVVAGDLNGRLQSFAVAVQQVDVVKPLTLKHTSNGHPISTIAASVSEQILYFFIISIYLAFSSWSFLFLYSR